VPLGGVYSSHGELDLAGLVPPVATPELKTTVLSGRHHSVDHNDLILAILILQCSLFIPGQLTELTEALETMDLAEQG